MRFPTTKWDLIQALQQDAVKRREALGTVYQLYWRPLYAYLRCESSAADSEDLLNGFFEHCWEDRVLEHADSGRGKFRTFILTCLKHYVSNIRRAENAGKRKPTGGFVALEDLLRDSGPAFEPRDGETPEDTYRRVWLDTIRDRALRRYRDQCRSLDLGIRYELFRSRVLDGAGDCDPRSTSYAALGKRFGISENAANKAVLKAIEEIRAIVCEEVARYSGSDRESAEDAAYIMEPLTARHVPVRGSERELVERPEVE
jgi:RNA polymerase sigma-70 factor (ECF subfamily)